MIEISDVDDHITLKGILPDLAFDPIVKEHPYMFFLVILEQLHHVCLLSDRKSRLGCKAAFWIRSNVIAVPIFRFSFERIRR